MTRRRFYISRSDRRGLCVLVFLLVCVLVGRYLYLQYATAEDVVAEVAPSEKAEVARLEAAIREDSMARATAYEEKYAPRKAELFPFDPNTADSLTLLRLGLAEWQVGNMMKYRRKGGVWHSATDFARLYGLTAAQYQQLSPYIQIAPEFQTAQKSQAPAVLRDSVRAQYVQKYPEGTVIDLNEADTSMLKRIPGIGSYYASKICKYRERLGGFVSVSQIGEVEGLPQGVQSWFRVGDNPVIHKLNVNTATFSELVRHPYLDYEQVKVIVNYRQKYGRIKSWSDLSLSELFDEKTIEKISPYFCF